MAYVLGIKPEPLTVRLYRDADFDSVVVREDEAGAPLAWDPGTVVRLHFPRDGEEWEAALEGANANFAVDKVQTNTRQHGEPAELFVGDQCWAAGKVDRKGA